MGLVSSLRFWGDGLVASAARGTSDVQSDLFKTNTRFDWDGLTFLDISNEGEMDIRVVDGSDVMDGWKGWLADEAGSLVAFVNRRTGASVSNPASDAELVVINLDTAAERQLVAQWAYEGQLFQPRAGYWLFQAADTPICDFTLFDSNGMNRHVPFRYAGLVCEYPPVGGRGRGRLIEIPWSNYAAIPFRAGAGYLVADVTTEEVINGTVVTSIADDGMQTRGNVMPPGVVATASARTGTAAISRYGKSLEVQSIVSGDAQHLAWMEASLHRVDEVGP